MSYSSTVSGKHGTWILKRWRRHFLNSEAKAVVVVNLYGVPAKLDEISAICEAHGAVLIENAAESLGRFL
ncbi:MAG: DegT/DnrJ/EryC1/StrS family aminotransferase [Merdibacter sp.]